MRLLLLVFFLVFTACTTRTARRESPRPPPSKRPAPVAPPAAAGTKKPGPAPVTQAPPVVQDETRKAVEAERAGDLLAALREYLSLSVSAAPAQQDAYRLKALDIVETRLDEGQLRAVGGDSDYGYLRGHALYRLGEISLERRENDEARKNFSSVVSFLPGTDLAFQAEQALAQLESLKYVESKTIGAVLPLSGKNAAVGQRTLRAIEMGLGLSDGNSNFKLAVMDSEGNPDAARRGVERLVKEDNVIAIIGSLLSKTAAAVSAKADELGVPAIGLSQKAGLTETGPNVFRNAVTSEMQVRQLVRTAMDMGLRRFAILAPNDPYGAEYASIFWDEVLARGGAITAAQMYDSNSTDLRGPCQRLVNTWYIEGREDEYKMLAREAGKDDGQRRRSVRQEKSADDVLPPIVDFDAVFIPDSAKMMGTAAAFLSYAGVRNVKLLGTNLWNTPGIAKRAGLFADQLIFVDGWQTPMDDAKAPRFYSDYRKLFGETPSMIEIQAYETALILRSLVLQGASSREQLNRRLTDLKGFPGLFGRLEMSPQREIRRPLVTYQTERGVISPVSGQ